MFDRIHLWSHLVLGFCSFGRFLIKILISVLVIGLFIISISCWFSLGRGHVWMWELDCKESWAPKNWCFWTVVLEKTLESPLNSKEIKPVNVKGNQSWILIGRTDAEAEDPILWPPDAKSRLIRKDSDAGKDWGQEEEGTTKDEMVGWHHWLNRQELSKLQELVMDREA